MSPHDPVVDIAVEDAGRSPMPASLRPLTCPLLDRQLVWCIGARLDLAAGGIDLTLAPAGRYQAHERMLVGWTVLEEWETLEPSELLGRTFWRNLRHRRPELPLQILPPTHVGPRPLLLTQSPGPHPWGARALEDASGHRLAGALGTTLPGLLATFETAHLLEDVHESPRAAWRRLEEHGRLHGRDVVVLGARTATMLGGGEEVRDLGTLGGTLAGVVPDPSVAFPWTLPGAIQATRDLLVDVLISVRPRKAPDLPDGLAAVRAGRWAGWQALADAGVAVHSPVPGHAWRPRRADLEGGPAIAWSRRWAGGTADIAPHREGWILAIEHHHEDIDGHPESHGFAVRKIEQLLEAIRIAEQFAACHRFREVAGEVARG